MSVVLLVSGVTMVKVKHVTLLTMVKVHHGKVNHVTMVTVKLDEYWNQYKYYLWKTMVTINIK
jgi:hypothetical protein